MTYHQNNVMAIWMDKFGFVEALISKQRKTSIMPTHKALTQKHQQQLKTTAKKVGNKTAEPAVKGKAVIAN